MYRKTLLFLFSVLFLTVASIAQTAMTPELLWQLKRVGFVAQSPDGAKILYKTTSFDVKKSSTSSEWFLYDIASGTKTSTSFDKDFILWNDQGIYGRTGGDIYRKSSWNSSWEHFTSIPKAAMDVRISPDERYVAYSLSVPARIKTEGNTIHKDMPENTAKIYNDLDYRHWDAWHDGTVNHVFIHQVNSRNEDIDILEGTDFNTPQKPFGGAEDFVFSPDSKTLVYVCKKKIGKEYATSTNTDIYAYDLFSGHTKNLSQGMMGYDVAPQFNKQGTKLAWLSMARDGYEADKNDLVVLDLKSGKIDNLTQHLDMTIDGGFMWTSESSLAYNATNQARTQVFVTDASATNVPAVWRDAQVTVGDHDVTGIYGRYKDNLIVSRTDFNHASELFLVDIKSGKFTPISQANDAFYGRIALSEVKMRTVKTTHGHDMGVWVIYPPDFDPNKKYPTLLYCQGGPQGAVSQFYSFRWNFQLMAAHGYIVVAPNRTGLPGYGVEWNEAISGDWGGQPMEDYLAAIDDVAKEPYVDRNRLGAVGASYGGYSVFMLAGIHQDRFKTFIAHCGLFNMRSWYGTTEEMWFANWDLGGSYWQENPPKAYTDFDPSSYVQYWNTPILIFQGEKDFRVPVGQGQEAFQAAQLRGIKSRFIVFPDENHWILKPQNSIVWHREFFKWLRETL